MHGMVSTLPLSSNPPLASRLKILREREDAWKRLEWKRKCELDRSPGNLGFEFANGFAFVPSSYQDAYIQSIDFFELPSADSPSAGEVTRAHMGNLSVVDFTMDPGQDLLVLVAVSKECVRLRIFVYVVVKS
jgi:hypothetical protein